ncbi:MAG: hypothetical protein R3F44_14675 [Candidatus Competibacteraceae bacterium]
MPTRFGEQLPARQYLRRALSVREALATVANIPAVAVLEQVGPVRGGPTARGRPAAALEHGQPPARLAAGAGAGSA